MQSVDTLPAQCKHSFGSSGVQSRYSVCTMWAQCRHIASKGPLRHSGSIVHVATLRAQYEHHVGILRPRGVYIVQHANSVHTVWAQCRHTVSARACVQVQSGDNSSTVRAHTIQAQTAWLDLSNIWGAGKATHSPSLRTFYVPSTTPFQGTTTRTGNNKI